MGWLAFIERVIIPTLEFVFLAGGVAGATLGAALLVRSDATLSFMAASDRWISTRQALRPLEVPHDIEPGPALRKPWLGGFLVLGSAFALYFLLARIDLATRASLIAGTDVKRWLTSAMPLQVMKWFLVVGSAFALIVGLLMLFAPQLLSALEARLNRWHSTRNLVAADERMHIVLEPYVRAHPLVAGWAILACSLVVALAMAGLLLR